MAERRPASNLLIRVCSSSVLVYHNPHLRGLSESYNHGSAQAIDIITRFICDTLTNACGADQTAKDTCAKAQTAADGQPPKTGAQADAFNAVFGIKTDFAAVTALDDQGKVVSATPSTSSTDT